MGELPVEEREQELRDELRRAAEPIEQLGIKAHEAIGGGEKLGGHTVAHYTDRATRRIDRARELAAPRKVEKLPGERSCLVRLSGGDRSQSQLQWFASGVLETLEKYAPALGAVVACNLDAMTVEVVFTPDEELPGDGQRADKALRVSEEWVKTLAEALGDIAAFDGADWDEEGVCGLAVDALSAYRLAAVPLVRDTEREHEPAKPQQLEDDLEPFVGIANIGRKGLWMPVEVGNARGQRAKMAEHHAEVLAKALDQFFHDRDHNLNPRRTDDLWHATMPTLRALGYPKEET